MYVDYEFFCRLYDDIDRGTFERLLWEAERLIDHETTGVDGIKKLKIFFPSNPDDAETVRRCICSLVDAMRQVQVTERAMQQVATASGVHSGVITSISSGGESISYAPGAQTQTQKAATDTATRKAMYADIVHNGLSGVQDCNGVNLLYMGPYPTGRWSGCTPTP